MKERNGEPGLCGLSARSPDACAEVSEQRSIPRGVLESMLQVKESDPSQVYLDGLVCDCPAEMSTEVPKGELRCWKGWDSAFAAESSKC